MEGFLALGFLIGMQHALEADHLAAIGAMLDGEPRSKSGLVLRGAAWGLGHAVTLFVICSAVILMGFNLTDRLSSTLDFFVGVMLLILGIDVLRKLWNRRIQLHLHSHADQAPHIYKHSGECSIHARDNDSHVHPRLSGFPKKALVIGLIHGSAGSAGLLALAVAATQQPIIALGYVLIFSIGTIVGMAALTLIVAWPLGAAERYARWINKAAMIAAGLFASGLGLYVMVNSSAIFAG